MQTADETRSKSYNRTKVRLSVADISIDIAYIALLAFSGVSAVMVARIRIWGAVNPYLEFLSFIALAGAVRGLIGLPLAFYSGYLLEHRYGLSHQTLMKWAVEQVKSLLLGIAIGAPLALLFLYVLRATGGLWWLYFGAAVFLLAVLLARLAPVIIFPLFYKFTPLPDGEVKESIRELLERYGIRIRGIYSFNLSKDTRKANAGFTGIGRSKRIVLSDTLLERFTPGEIRVIFAHELGHYRRRHIPKNIVISGAVILVSFYLCGAAFSRTAGLLGFASIHETAALPIVLFYLTVLGIVVMPLTNALSRRFEREADRFALEITGLADEFIDSMEKLAEINLADRDPSAVVEFMFYGHPSIRKRIEFARVVKSHR